MTSGIPFSNPELKYIADHKEEWPSVIAYHLSVLYKVPRTARGVRKVLKNPKISKM